MLTFHTTGIRRISASLSITTDDELDDKGFQDEEMASASETKTFTKASKDLEELGLKLDEKLFIEIEKTFTEIAGSSIMGKLACSDSR